MKRLLTTLVALSFATSASAATLTLPAFTVGTGAATGISCSPPISSTLAAPVAAGTLLTSCTISPLSWVGTVTQSNPALAVVMTSTATFSLVVGTAPLAAGSQPATVITATP